MVQLFPPQQGPPSAPQTVQIEFLQMVLASLQVLLAQQGPPAAPQARQVLVLLSQTALVSLQADVVEPETLVQQGCVRPPQIWHEYLPVRLE